METVQFSPFPELNTARLLLRQLRPSDAPALYQLRSDPVLMQYIPRPLAKDEADALALIEMYNQSALNNEAINWCIADKETDELLGAIGFVRMKKENFRAEIGYILRANQQGKGIMKEALQAVEHYGFHVLKFHSLEAVIDPGNTASAMLLEKCGFVKEAHLRDYEFLLGRFWDSVIYSKLTPIP